MNANLLTSPRLRKHWLETDSVWLGFGFIQWRAEQYRDDRFLCRVYFGSWGDARSEVERIQATGLRRLPDARPARTEVPYGELSDGRFIDNLEYVA